VKEPFAITRADGRSNTQVICDLVGECQPGRIFSYEELGKFLSAGTRRNYEIEDVQGAVRLAGPKLGRIHKRALVNVKLTGYRLVPAEEHRVLAVDRQNKASRQLKRGFEILRDVRLEEIKDLQVRSAIQGQLMIVSGLFYAVAAHERRIDRVEQLIDDMLHEGKDGGKAGPVLAVK